MLDLGLEEAEGAPYPGSRRHEHDADLERPRHLRREERAVAAEGNEGEFLRVASALDGDGAHGAGHSRASQEIHAVGRLVEIEAETGRDLLAHRAPRAVRVQGEATRQALG